MDLHLYLHVIDDGISAKLDAILAHVRRIGAEELQIMKELDDLTTQVKANTDVEQSAVTLIQGIAAKLQAAGTDPAALTALTTELQTSAQALAAAVAANTPAAPPARGQAG